MPANGSGIHYRATDVRRLMPQWLIGQLADTSHLNDVIDAINSNPQAVQVSTITIDTVTSSATYTWTIDSVEFSIVADASAVNTEIGDAIVDAIDADPLIRGTLSAARTSATVVTLTGLTPGLAFTLSDSDAKLTCATVTASDTADAVPFGRLVLDGGYSDSEQLCALAAAAALTAQVDSWAVTYETVLLHVEITVDGVSYSASHTMVTDLDTSIDAFVVKINADEMGLPANTVIASANAATATALVLTSEVAGKPFTSRMWLGVGATVAAPALTRTAPVTSDVNNALGISLHTYDEQDTAPETDEVVYPANAGVKIARSGRVAVACSEVVTAGAPVYVELGSSGNNGKFYVASSATRVRLNRAKWERAERAADSNDVAILRLAPA